MIVMATETPPPPPPAPEPAVLRNVPVRCRIPLWYRVEILRRRRSQDDVAMIEFIFATPGRWKRWDATHDTRHLDVFVVGPFIIAVGLQ